jgi:hypothetical protein
MSRPGRVGWRDTREPGDSDRRGGLCVVAQEACRRARGVALVAPVDIAWLDGYAQKVQTAISPPALLDRLPMAAE